MSIEILSSLPISIDNDIYSALSISMSIDIIVHAISMSIDI